MKIARIACLVALTAVVAAPIAASPAPLARIETLVGKAPAWYTPELHARVLASGTKGVALPEGSAVPASSLAFLGIRPGQLLIIGGGTLCSSNFVFHNGPNYAIGTAGHCGNPGAQVTMVTGPGLLLNIGSISVSVNGGIGNDFALIPINPALSNRVSPSMAIWGGPTGNYFGPGAPRIVRHVGWGLVVGTGGLPRVGVGTVWTPTEWRFAGVIYSGDSGSGAEGAAGLAIGNITHRQTIAGVNTGINFGTSISRILQITGLPLATCRNIPWPYFGCPHI